MNQTTKEIIGVSVTATRYGMAEWISKRLRDGKPIILPMIGFIAADVLDGVILRKFNMDTPVRRVADGVVDHASVARVAFEVARKNPESRKYIGFLALRAASVGIANGPHLLKTGEVTKGNVRQKATNIASAAFGVIASSNNKEATEVAGIAASAIAMGTASKHFKNFGTRGSGPIRVL